MKRTNWLFFSLVFLPFIYTVAVYFIGDAIAAFEIKQNPYEHPFFAAIFFLIAIAFGLLAWLAGCIVAIVGGIEESRIARKDALTGVCKNCGYQITGLKSDRCPECGKQFMTADQDGSEAPPSPPATPHP